jgi:hypothetical protein
LTCLYEHHTTDDALSCLLARCCLLLLLQVFTQLALVLLLWGTMCGGLALISDVGVILIDRLAAAGGEWVLPGWVNGRSCMTAVALLVLFPLCLLRRMREVGVCGARSNPASSSVRCAAQTTADGKCPAGACCVVLPRTCFTVCALLFWPCASPLCYWLQLETAATAGVVLVLGLISLLAVDACRNGFPAIRDKSLPLWSLKVDGHLPEAFSVVGYAFYMQASSWQGVLGGWRQGCSRAQIVSGLQHAAAWAADCAGH